MDVAWEVTVEEERRVGLVMGVSMRVGEGDGEREEGGGFTQE